MESFRKVVRIGTMATRPTASVFCEIKYDAKGELSITGVEGPRRNGDAWGSCGQIVMSFGPDDIGTYADGWDPERLASFLSVWERWHLNHMVAGSPAQMAYLRDHPITDRLNYYGAACAALADVGLNPDPNYLHNGEPYRYGHAWLSEDVPEYVYSFLCGLPETDQEPAWI